ncbi:MAG: efflux RND transporter periplasmic adaptor subunit [Chloroflexi bacterium]|nr:efflux RND transporter periplasmic adaptor subunit [Chloroflexota bacterium]
MKRARLVTILIIVLVIVSTAVWWLAKSVSTETSTDILTSGFIEARNVTIAAEVSGRIVDIAVDEGSAVTAGKTLVKLDDSLQKAQLQQAEAAVKVARSAVEQATASRSQAMIYKDGAKKAWEDAVDVQKNPLELDARIAQAQSQLDMAKLAVEYSKDTTLYSLIPKGPWDRAFARQQRDGAQMVLQSLLNIKDNPQAINTIVDQSYAAYQTALAAAEVSEKATGLATAQVEQAQASLDVLKIQISKTVLISPISGVVAARDAEVGEIALPGARILNITELARVTLTAYVPESKIGRVKLGQRVSVFVDSYPGESFSGKVTFVSPEAQFTPRNVQLKEEREKTVFAVKVSLDNPEQKLKPGVPADARIITGSEG